MVAWTTDQRNMEFVRYLPAYLEGYLFKFDYYKYLYIRTDIENLDITINAQKKKKIE